MSPTVNIGPILVYSFGLFCVLAYIAGSFLFWRKLKEEIAEELLIKLSFFVAVSATLGARIVPAVYAFALRPTFDMFVRAFIIGDLSFWGGFMGGMLPLYLWGRKDVKQLWDLLDPVGEIFLWVATIVSLGSMFAKLWVGKQTSFLGLGSHPVGLYLSLWCFLGIMIAFYVKKSYRGWIWYRSGKVGLVGLISFSWFFLGFLGIASLVEKQIYLGPFALDQILSLIVLLLLITLIWYRAGRKYKEFFLWLPRKALN